MKCFVLSSDQLHAFIETLMGKMPLMGPRQRPDQPGFYHFDWLTSPEELALHYTTTTIPPKKAFFPPVETLFTFKLSNPPEMTRIREETPFVLAGVHPCDLAAIDALDDAYSVPPVDRRWLTNRKRATIIGIDCLPDEYCFCTSMNTFDARRPCDLFLTRIDRGWLCEIHSKTGQNILEGAQKDAAQKKDIEDAEQWRLQKSEKILTKLHINFRKFADILDAGGLTDIWKEIADRCYSCGSCNTTCPTCFCFDKYDELDMTLNSGVRKRVWDSCQLSGFAMVAGEHNFRGERWERVRHRWHRKFLYLFRQFNRPYCTGCGRCSRACTADINMADVINQLVGASEKERTDV